MVDRIAVQAAILRRSIDRLWEDQSIETCDDWVIAYIGDLLATNLISSLDARGQRLDVAKTIYYRRRKGTVAVLEEIARDITGWNARVVEFFHRLGRTRHSIDPPIGWPAQTTNPEEHRMLQQTQGLVGSLTKTPMGGLADLRNVYGSSKAHSAFDEFFYTADFRRGRGQVGWHNIPRLGVFLWRLYSFPAGEPTNSYNPLSPNKGIGIAPVEYAACPGHYTFDPTGREIPLFADASRPFGDNWVSPAEWQLPVEISKALLKQELHHLYAIEKSDSIFFNSLGIFDGQGNLIPVELITADSRNWNAVLNPGRDNFAFLIEPENGKFIKGGKAFDSNVFVTYHYGFSSSIGAGFFDRRILRQPPTPMPNPQQEAIAGENNLVVPLTNLGPTGTLTILDSLTYTQVSQVIGIEKVTVRSENKTRPLIRLPASTPDASVLVFDGANDSSELILEGLFVSGGDIVLRGKFKSVILICCTFDPGEMANSPESYAKAVDGRELIPCRLWIEAQVEHLTIDRCILGSIGTRLMIPETEGESSFEGAIATLTVSDSIIQSLGSEPAINLSSGKVNLTRSNILGTAKVHQLEASECILDNRVEVDNPQQGCVRFSAWVTNSILPKPYESVEIPPKSPLFATRRFGQPSYCQLQLGADAAILNAKDGKTITAGAQDGSEMGAFAREKNPIKERSLRIKYEEYMPLGLIPVIIYAT